MMEKKKEEPTVKVEKSQELQLMEAQSAAQFAMTPVGQMVKEFEAKQRIARMYSISTLVPPTFSGQENLGNCIIALDMAMRMNANPLMVMQNLAVIHNQPSWSSKFLIACINASGKFSPLRYECNNEEGSKLAWRAYAYDKNDINKEEPLYGSWISLEMADREGWSKKAGSKWLTMPEQMMKYRAAAFWQRTYAPEISMGFMTTDEIEDITPVDVTPQVTKSKSKFAAMAEQALKGGVEDVEPQEEVETQSMTEQNTPNSLFDE